MNCSVYSPSFRIDDILKKSSSTTQLPSISIKDKIQSQHIDRKADDLWSYFYAHCNRTKTNSRRKGGQIRFSVKQSLELEKRFEINQFLSPIERQQAAQALQLSERQIKTWFQNRRAKHRRSTMKNEMDKSCFSSQQTDEDNESN